MSGKSRRRPPEPRARVRLGNGPPTPTAIACPDCDSEVEITQITGQIKQAVVRHDDSCPWYAALKHDLA